MDKALEIIKNKKAMVICGGGVLGIAECGSLIQLEELGLDLRFLNYVSGSSVGSILATAVACRASTEYMKDLLESMDFTRFHDRDGLLRSLWQLIKRYGINETKEINRLATKILTDLVENPDITFKQLYELTDTHLQITYYSTNYDITLVADHVLEPDSLVREAIVASASIPGFYEAFFDKKDKDVHVKCDGGTLNNYPMNLPRELGYDPNQIIGLKLLAPRDFNHVDNGGKLNDLGNRGAPKNIVRHLMRIINALRSQAMRVHVDKGDWMLSVKINVGDITATDFGLTKDQSDWLLEQGKEAVNNHVAELAGLLEKGEYLYENEDREIDIREALEIL